MEAALKNLASTAELLAVAAAQSDVVGQWDKHTLSRAFDWARYCENLYSRFHNNHAIRSVMEKHLCLTNQSLRANFPAHTALSFSDLSRCQHLLLVGLLNNPELPISIMKILFSPVNTKQSECGDADGFCSHIVQCRSACKVLSSLTDGAAVGAEAEVQGVMLLERLGALLSQSSEASRTEHFVDSVLQGCEGAAGHFCMVIAAALLTMENSASQTASQDFLLDWLQEKHSVLQLMCSTLPSTHLISLAKEHLKFRDTYYGVLKKWASDFEYSINDGEWVQTSTNRTISFKKLIKHFLALFEACPSLRKDLEKELNALKMSDGDFDVEGLSVWGDLLSALKK